MAEQQAEQVARASQVALDRQIAASPTRQERLPGFTVAVVAGLQDRLQLLRRRSTRAAADQALAPPDFYGRALTGVRMLFAASVLQGSGSRRKGRDTWRPGADRAARNA